MTMKTNSKMFNASPVYREVLSSGAFVALKERDRSKIKSTKIVPPRLGSKDFGGVMVEYKTPVYKVG